MISRVLWKRNMSICVKPFLIIFAFLCMYTVVIVYMYNPKLSTMLSQYQEALPEMMAAFGMTGVASSLLEWMSIYLYGFIMLLFPLIFIIIIVNKLLMNDIDRGSMANLLATPNSRGKIIRTQLFSIYVWITILMFAISIVGILCSQVMFPKQLDIKAYLFLNLGTLLLWFAVASIAFAAACFVSESKYYFMVGAGIPILFFVFQMIGNMGEKLEYFRYLTIYTLLPIQDLIKGQGDAIVPCSFLLLFCIVFTTLGVVRFQTRDLSL